MKKLRIKKEFKFNLLSFMSQLRLKTLFFIKYNNE